MSTFDNGAGSVHKARPLSESFPTRSVIPCVACDHCLLSRSARPPLPFLHTPPTHPVCFRYCDATPRRVNARRSRLRRNIGARAGPRLGSPQGPAPATVLSPRGPQLGLPQGTGTSAGGLMEPGGTGTGRPHRVPAPSAAGQLEIGRRNHPAKICGQRGTSCSPHRDYRGPAARANLARDTDQGGTRAETSVPIGTLPYLPAPCGHLHRALPVAVPKATRAGRLISLCGRRIWYSRSIRDSAPRFLHHGLPNCITVGNAGWSMARGHSRLQPWGVPAKIQWEVRGCCRQTPRPPPFIPLARAAAVRRGMDEASAAEK